MVKDPELLKSLVEASQLQQRAGRAITHEYAIWDDPEIKIKGWKFNEWDYGKPNIKLPINARGLFTIGDTIVVRGYDKFFNLDEKPYTKWEAIQKDTQGPYTVSLKENGCIVFMSGLENGTLIVTSKHSTGPRKSSDNHETNHSYVALKWVETHLSRSNLTKRDFALWLHEHDLTAVGELCDDEFEEHILPYNGDKRGIYLHGLNKNTAVFESLSFDQVHEATQKFGFLETQVLSFDTVSDLQTFLEDCAKTGSWNGTPVEGFVVRCRNKSSGATFFFKYKFDEPYLLYREWREITKMYCHGRARNIRFKRNKELGKKYLHFIQPILQDDATKQMYLRNKGIIKLREQFLQSLITNENPGLTTEGLVGEIVKHEAEVPSKYVFVTVATIGCGKTTVSLALQKLTGWGHVQNDNITGSGATKKFANAIRQSLDTDAVAVIADRNNHMFRERKQIFEDVGYTEDDNVAYDIRFVCLNFLPTGPSSSSWSVTRERVRQRKDNHQSIKDLDDSKVTGIMKGFVNRFQAVDVEVSPDSLFDLVIDLDVEKGSEYNLRLILDTIRDNNLFKPALEDLPKFTDDQISSAMTYALNYQPTITKVVKPSASQKRSYEFFAFYIDQKRYDLVKLIDDFFVHNTEADSTLWTQLKKKNAIQSEFHVTVLHWAALKQVGDSKKRFKDFSKKAENSKMKKISVGKLEITPIEGLGSSVVIKKIGFSDKILALEVLIENHQLQSSNSIAHVTIGTLGLAAKESLTMLSSVRSSKYEWNVDPKRLDNLSLAAYKRN